MNKMLFDSNSVIDIIETLRNKQKDKTLQSLKTNYEKQIKSETKYLLTEINTIFDDENSKVVSQYLATDNNHGNYYKLHNKLMSMYNSSKVSDSNKTKLFPLIVDNYKSFMGVLKNTNFKIDDVDIKDISNNLGYKYIKRYNNVNKVYGLYLNDVNSLNSINLYEKVVNKQIRPVIVSYVYSECMGHIVGTIEYKRGLNVKGKEPHTIVLQEELDQFFSKCTYHTLSKSADRINNKLAKKLMVKSNSPYDEEKLSGEKKNKWGREIKKPRYPLGINVNRQNKNGDQKIYAYSLMTGIGLVTRNITDFTGITKSYTAKKLIDYLDNKNLNFEVFSDEPFVIDDNYVEDIIQFTQPYTYKQNNVMVVVDNLKKSQSVNSHDKWQKYLADSTKIYNIEDASKLDTIVNSPIPEGYTMSTIKEEIKDCNEVTSKFDYSEKMTITPYHKDNLDKSSDERTL